MTTYQDPAPEPPEVARNGLATKVGTGGAGALAVAAIVDAIAGNGVDGDTRTALVGAVVLAAVTMIGKYAQAVAGIIGDRVRGHGPVGELVAGELGRVQFDPGLEERIAEAAASRVAAMLYAHAAGVSGSKPADPSGPTPLRP